MGLFCRRPRMAAIIGGQAAPTQMKQFEVVGHRTGGAIGASATVKDGQEAVYRMHLFAPNETVARSRFWYFVSQFKKLKRANGEILSCKEIFEKNAGSVKNFGIWIRYDSRSLTHNLYKEYRDVTLTGAVTQMYQDMAARYRARFRSVQILKTATVASKDCKRESVKAFHDRNIQFPVTHKIQRSAIRKHRVSFKASKPQTW